MAESFCVCEAICESAIQGIRRSVDEGDMVLDLIFGLILLAMIALGAWRGAVVSGSGLFSMVCGYVAGIFAATAGSEWVASSLSVPPLVAPAIAGTLGFVVVWLVVSSIADVLAAWDRERVELGGRSFVDRGLGGLFGLARGGLIVVLLALLASWLDAARDLDAVAGLDAMPDATHSRVAAAAGSLVEVAVVKALDAGPAGVIAARITAHPGQTLGSVKAILEDDRLSGLFQDRLFWTLISNNSVDYAMNRNAIRSVVNDSEMRGRFADLGLVEEAARDDVRLFRDTMAEVLVEIGPQVQKLQRDPALKELAEDPEILGLIEGGNPFALMNHPRIRELVTRISSESSRRE